MKLESAQVRNFRMLKEMDIDFEDVLSLVIGKNNSGKTSFLSILQKFISETRPEFAFEDFNIETQKAILKLEGSNKSPEDYTELGLSLKLYIVYNEADNLGDAAALLLDLDTDNHHLVVLFEYSLPYEKYQKLTTDYAAYKAKGIDRDFAYYVSNNDQFDKNHLIRKDDQLNEFLEKHAEAYDRIKVLPTSQVLAYYKYYNDFSPYSTQHGIKGAEFDNVLVVMDNGKWNNYNFKYYFESTPGKESIIQRTERIFYVCCSRAKSNLVVYYPNPTAQVISRAKSLFGVSNVHSLSTATPL